MNKRNIIEKYCVLVLILLVIFSLIPNMMIFSQGQEVSIKEAMDSGDITATFVSKGAASGHVANILINNEGTTDLTLDLANSGLEGMVLSNQDESEQDEVITGTPGVSTGGSGFDSADNVTVDAGKSVIIPVIGYCMNYNLDTPSLSIEFDLSSISQKTSIEEISGVVDTLDSYEFPDNWGTGHVQRVEQMAIWTSQQDNKDVPLSEFSGRGYSLDDNDIRIISDILNRSGKDPSNVAALTGIEKEDDDLGILDDIPWFVVVLIIVAIILAGIVGTVRSFKKRKAKLRRYDHPQTPAQLNALEFYKKKRKECEELNKKCKEAGRKAQEAEQKAQKTESNANETRSASEKATSQREEAELEFEEFEMERDEKEKTFAESDKEKVTSYDLKLKNEASKELWKQYQNGEIDAATLEKVWEDLEEEDALKELRKKDKEDRELPLQDALEQAKLFESEAKAKADLAHKNAENASSYAKAAREYADKICKKAHDCNEAAKAAYEAAGYKPAKKARPPKVIEPQEKPTEKGEGSEDEFEGPEEPELEDDDKEELEIEEDLLEGDDSDDKSQDE
jgi:hypothetical protein